ncbi:MAG: NTP transferase domain-containing protein [Sphingorhabdus sp.]
MKILGAILAGGQSRRFGSDKAEALFEGKALLDRVAEALPPQCTELVIAGREWPGLTGVADIPEAGLGPLGGLAGALDYAERNGFDAVLSCGCDLLGVPADLAKQLGAAPAILDDLPIVGLWPVDLADTLAAWLADPANRSVYRFADFAGARRVLTPASITNVNRASDLATPASPKA